MCEATTRGSVQCELLRQDGREASGDSMHCEETLDGFEDIEWTKIRRTTSDKEASVREHIERYERQGRELQSTIEEVEATWTELITARNEWLHSAPGLYLKNFGRQ